MFTRRSFSLSVPALLFVGTLAACATDTMSAAEGTTSVAVLGSDDGVLGSSEGSGGNTVVSTLPAYPTRDANLWTQSNQAWQTFAATHWGNADWVGTTFDYAHILDALAVNIEVNSARRYAGFSNSLAVRVAAGDYNLTNTDTLDSAALMALGLAHLYNATASATNLDGTGSSRATLLAQAQNYFVAVAAVEDTDNSGNSLGLWIDTAHSSRRTSVNGAAILAAMQLYRATNSANMLSFAKRIYAAWYQAAVNSSTFTVADGVENSGTVDAPMYTYNYGLMIGAAVALHRATGEAHYLAEARGMATALLGTMTTTVASQVVLTEPLCTSSSCGPALVHRGPTLRALAQLAAVDGNNSAVQNVLNGTAAALAKNRNTDGHWPVNWSASGPSIQDPAADLAVVLSLGYLSLSAPKQAQPSPPATTLIATEAWLDPDLPISPGGDGKGSWATVGPFASASQQVHLRFTAPVAGSASLKVRYAVPDTTTPSLNVSVNGASPAAAVALMSTGSATTMATSSAVNATLSAGVNSVDIGPASAAITAQIDTVTLAMQQTLTGATCTPTTSLVPEAPIAGDRICGLPTFTWKGGSGSQAQSDIIIDGAIACTVHGTAQSCTLTQALVSGRHTWQVMEDGCSLSSIEAFDVSQQLPVAVAATLSTQGSDTILTWPSPSDTQVVDVTLNGTLVCGKLPNTSCTIATASLAATGQNNVIFAASNFCGLTPSTQTF